MMRRLKRIAFGIYSWGRSRTFKPAPAKMSRLRSTRLESMKLESSIWRVHRSLRMCGHSPLPLDKVLKWPE